MVKGISRQVIVVHAPEPKLFEQAILSPQGNYSHHKHFHTKERPGTVSLFNQVNLVNLAAVTSLPAFKTGVIIFSHHT